MTIGELASHNHSPAPDESTTGTHAFTLNRHYNTDSVARQSVSAGSGLIVMGAKTSASDYAGVSDISQASKTTSSGSGVAHNNLQPYIGVYIYVRTL